MKTILVATDFSERSDRALRRATLVARRYGAALSLVHVVDDDQPRPIVTAEVEAAKTLLRETAEHVRAVDGLRCEHQLVLADPFAGIIRAANEMLPDLVVVGAHRRQPLRDAFFGTTAERTIRNISFPTLMVNSSPLTDYRHVLVSTDLSEPSRHTVSTAFSLGLSNGAKATLLHVYDAPASHLAMGKTMSKAGQNEYLAGRRTEAARKLAAFVFGLGGGEADQVVVREQTTAAHAILAAAKELDADLIVVGTGGYGDLARLILGNTAGEVLRSAKADVLAIPMKPGT